MQIRRGDVVDIDFGTPWGSEQGGIRPAIVVQNDIGNRYSPAIQVTPITSQYKKRLPTHGDLYPSMVNGLSTKSVFMTEQTRAVDKTRVLGWRGRLSPEEMAKVDVALIVNYQLTVLGDRVKQGNNRLAVCAGGYVS